MPRRTYVGDNAAVIVELADGNVEVARGESVDVSPEMAALMDESAAWTVSGKDKKEAVNAG